MGITRIELGEPRSLTRSEKRELKQAFKRPIVFDDDAPELTEKELKEFAKVARAEREAQKKMLLRYVCLQR